MTVVLGAHLRQQLNLEILIGSYRVLKKSANAIVKTYGKVFGPESLAASAPDKWHLRC
jgi:hypothetical protein